MISAIWVMTLASFDRDARERRELWEGVRRARSKSKEGTARIHRLSWLPVFQK